MFVPVPKHFHLLSEIDLFPPADQHAFACCGEPVSYTQGVWRTPNCAVLSSLPGTGGSVYWGPARPPALLAPVMAQEQAELSRHQY